MKYVFSALLLLSLTSWANNVVCPTPCTSSSGCLKEFVVDSKKIDFYSNYSLDQLNECVEKVIFVVHGAERNPQSRYRAVADVAKSLGVFNRVLIISPYFITDEDDPDSDQYYWSTSGWVKGNTSNNKGRDIGTFTVADKIISQAISGGKFPHLSQVSVTGHSAGGQFTQMYALTSLMPSQYPLIHFSFHVLNPSNYTYLNALRPYPGLPGHFELPIYESGGRLRMDPVYRQAAGNCPTAYNDYKYGLLERNIYSDDTSEATLINQYINREVNYFLGSLDNDESDDSLDDSCEAKTQGRQRLERGNNYFDFINQFFPGHHHAKGIVENVGHDARGMYASEIVKAALFNL